MHRKLQLTQDGSYTIAAEDLHATYHSIFGAASESMHVFINAGLKPLMKKYDCINIFEMGFGTGLNALLSLQQANENNQKIFYETVELFPLKENEYSLLNYSKFLDDEMLQTDFFKMHNCAEDLLFELNENFSFIKHNTSLEDFETEKKFQLIYFDAFAPSAQPELWTQKIFEKMFYIMSEDAVLVTYCSKGDVRRSLQAVGFGVEKLPGFYRKREMIKAKK